jgi:hypothetical protein
VPCESEAKSGGLEFRPLIGSEDEADARAYFGLGVLIVANRASGHYGGGDRFFTDMALGIMVRAG